MLRRRKILFGVAGLTAAGFLAIQVLPFDRLVWWLARNENPPVVSAVEWDSPQTEQLVRAACYDCHSNETVWPWYSYIAPVSWLVLRDVNQGRAGLNFSEDNPADVDVDDLEHHISTDMPKRFYLLIHPEARYTDEQKAALIAGLWATFGDASDTGSMDGMDMGDTDGE
jgi:hypothetical protein